MGEDSAARAAREIVVVFSRLRRRLREVSGVDDLTPSQTSVLSRLLKEGPSSASALATAERVRPQSMAAILTALDEQGLIRRQPDPADGRRQVIQLSEAGRGRTEGNRQAKEEWLVRTLAENLTEEEREVVTRAMGLLERLTGP
ncbi:MarR family winged helix-turn-helix transcriptional regulator [Hamadaea tsunoensis]|uniref:MarR family winged helix-turn-helix transcriptional regulator n=1 Tax=Hamadaea tsunoensis TaxID=53368 RepID=UPI0004034C81|nr:MarR family transcriptional regulator [Hamadaea tsunoensis]